MTFLRTRLHLGALTTVALIVTAAPAVVRAQDTTASIHYKGVTLTPVGFAAAEGVWRQKNEETDIGSSFNGIPFSGTSAAGTSELRLSGRQSRIGMLAQGSDGDMKFSGFWEADFLSAGVSSNSNESNSYTLRVRQFWAQAQSASGWTVDGGQMWSFLTTDKTGLLPRSEEIPLTIDAQYAAGFDWARQFGFRVAKKLGDMASAGISLEEPQATFTGSNLPGDFLVGAAGTGQLNTTNYSADVAPDVIAKIAFDPAGMGHWELKAVGSWYRDRIVDPASATVANTSHNSTTMGGGVGFGIYMPVKSGGTDMVDLGLSGLWGQGIGRYGTSMLSDVTVKQDSSLSPIQAAQTLLSIETHPMSNLDVYGYAGAEYAGRDTYVNAAGKGVGCGSPLNSNAGCGSEAAPTNDFTPATSGTCTGQTRAIYQGNLGFWYRFYKGAGGTLQWGMQYSYTSRNTWTDAAGNQPQAIENMLLSSFRYVLP